MLVRRPARWHRASELPGYPPPPRQVGRGELRATWVNHSTVLLQTDGLNLLTDPVWSERLGPVPGLGPRRHHPPGIRWDDLPPIDAVLLSHNHPDHLDLPTLERLAAAHQPQVLVPLGNRRLLERRGIPNVVELDWWQSMELAPGVRASAVPAQHFSGRGLWDRNRALWAGWVVQGAASVTVFAGDTGWGPHFRQIRERWGRARLALLPIGGFHPRRWMSPIHLSPQEAVRAHHALGAGVSIAVHWGCFRITDEAREQPVLELAETVEGDPAHPRFWVLQPGEGRAVPPVMAPPPPSPP